MKKRILSLLLAAMLIVGLVPSAGAFADVSDARLSARVEMLKGFGVINGYPDGSFKPQNTLTRAEFTKMVVTLLGGGKACETFGAYTIFGDVPSSDWAAKYINYAARDKEKGGLGLLKGYTDGSFRPNNTITYAESVTIVLRALGFADADVGYSWPKNFIDKAASCGLGGGVSRGANDAITRADAANMFYNALFVEQKDGNKLIDSMYGESISSALILSVDSEGVRIFEKPDDLFVNAAGLTSADVGTRKKLTLNEDGDAVMYAESAKMPTSDRSDAFIYSVAVDEEDGMTYVSLDGVTKTVCLAPIDEGWVARSAKLTVDSGSGVIVKAELLESRNRTIAFAYYSGDRVTSIDGEVFTVKADTPTYEIKDGRMSAAKDFSAVRDYLSYGDALELAIGSDGTVKHVVARTGEAKVALVQPGMKFAALREALGAPADVTIYKNGAETEFSALADYDAASYVAGSKVIMVSGFRMGAAYSYAVPNTTAPDYITVFGNVLRLAPCAVESVSKFKPNQRLTLLFAADGRVAGALEESNTRAVGLVSDKGVEFLGGPTLDIDTPDFEAGELVSVGCGANAQPSVSRVAERPTSSTLDVENMTLGDKPLAVGCVFFERGAAGQSPVRISIEDINRAKVPASKMIHVSYDAAGRANLIVFADVTGDRFDYGRVMLTTEERTVSGSTLTSAYDARVIELTNSAGSSKHDMVQTAQLPADMRVSDTASYTRHYAWGSIAVGEAASPAGGTDKFITAYKPLSVTVSVDRTGFVGSAAAKTDDGVAPIAKGVQVYLKSTNVFMKADGMTPLELVSAARAQGEKFDLLLDAKPSDGGKVRVIVVK